MIVAAGPRVGRRHKLLTEELRRRLPPLYSQEDKGSQAVAYVKFFTPDSNWTWWGLEFDLSLIHI